MGNEAESKPLRPFAEFQEGNGVFVVMDTTGDTKTIWDKNKPDEVEAARMQFTHLRSKGYLAYRAEGKEGERGEQLHEFDPNAERIVFAPPMSGG